MPCGWGKTIGHSKKNNEIFWSDAVTPEGVFVKKKFHTKSNSLNKLEIGHGHFILRSAESSFSKDSYFQCLQINSLLFGGQLALFALPF